MRTILGRAPLAPVAAARVADYQPVIPISNRPRRGARGRRDMSFRTAALCLTGAEAAVVVNNNAAATLLVLASLAAGREVIISRGELVEIGGGFRVPDVLAQSGAVLREVGTTNRTRAADYAAAISERTALILRVHPSNFRIEGFTQRPLAFRVDRYRPPFRPAGSGGRGSGYLSGSLKAGDAVFRDEPVISESIQAGAGVVMFSGDKLLGGPQAGIIVGQDALLARVRTHPLMRALRVDKMTYAALEATLEEYAADRAQSEVPVVAMIAMPLDEIERRARALADALTAMGIHAKLATASPPSAAAAPQAQCCRRSSLRLNTHR